MARIDTLQNFLTDLADKFRQYMGGTNKLPHKNFDTYIDYVYAFGKDDGDHAGYVRGVSDGKVTGYQEGKQAEYDAFWDAYQQGGNRTDYQQAFVFVGWIIDTFKPKYNMQPINANSMFYQFNASTSAIDLVSVLEELGVELDFSKTTNINYCFQNAKIKHIGIVDLSSVINVNTVFANTYWLNKIDKIIVNENNVFDNNCFLNSEVKDITFEGVLTSNLRIVSPLNKASIESLIGILSNNASGKTLTLKSSAVTNAFGSTTAQEWTNLITPKQNAGWTITLV